MISAIVLAADLRQDDDLGHVRELVVRSLVWLVSAVVSGVVRDVTLATPPGFGLSEVADQSGCNLVQEETEADRLAAAVAAARTDRLLIVRAGYEPDGRLSEELDTFMRRRGVEEVALIRAAPDTAIQRLLPDRAPVVALLVPKARAIGIGSFKRLVTVNTKGTPLVTRVARIP